MSRPTPRLRRRGAGNYETLDGRYAIVRSEHEWDDDEGVRRRRWFWEVSNFNQRWGAWEVGAIGWPTLTLRESRRLLAEHLENGQTSSTSSTDP